MTELLSADDLDSALTSLSLWAYDETRKAIHCALRFDDFATTVAFIVQVSMAAERADHHPEWSNVHTVMDIWLTTHDAAGVTERDIALARHIEHVAESNAFGGASS